ncbi:hypothetical protein B5E84_02155 [Lachnoclostridium sp. An14]|uniref:hypothetical protein n=1 Tax=Lachnoclostridium sp. An14 TaxID=1965562 RepID=UPI000B37CDA7|nr:hypothetical protein [Lachnoclostridium sp. An14]OUQ21549.1 hypothetical protein B5E84_02155 [Lachnoclostridium sp. An14]
MASSGQNRGFPEIIKFGNQFDQFCDSVSGIATKIASDAGKAESSLKDEVSKRNIQKVYEISMRLKNIVDRGEARERVRDMVSNAKREQAELEALER